MRLHITITAILCVITGFTLAAQTRSPEAQLKAAQHKERVEGDIKGAIELYKQLSTRADAGREVAAAALLGLAQSYEKLGALDARTVYQQIIRNYSDQGAIVAAARERVAALEVTPSRGLLARQLPKLSSSISGLTLLPDGRIGGTHWGSGDLVLIDPATGAVTSVVEGDFEKPAGATWAEHPVLSPDRRQLAYLWFGADPKEEKGILRVLPMEKGGKPRTVVADLARRNIVPLGWSRDSRAILVCYEKPVPADAGRPEGRGDFDLAWVTVASGTVRPIRSFEWWHSAGGNSIEAVRVSPDGEWIAYAVPERQGAADRSVFVMRADGSDHRRVAAGGVNDYPVWTPDGSRLVFLSTRSGDPALWSVDVKTQGEHSPVVIKNGMGRVILHGMLASGVLVYSEAGVDPLIVAELDAAAGSSGSPALRTQQTLHGLVPAWSPDGRHLAYKRRTINPSRPVEIVVQTFETGMLRTYAPGTGTMGLGLPTWYSDSIVQAVTRSGIHLKVNTTGFEEMKVPPTLPMGMVSPDGRTVFGSVANVGFSAFDVSSGTRTGTVPLPAGWRARSLSPDGRMFALQNTESGPGARVAVISVDGSGFRPITTPLPGGLDGLEGRGLSWSRDSSALILAVATGGERSAILRVPLDGKKITTIAEDILGLRGFDISPDGRRIAYSIHRPATEVWTLDLTTALK